MDEATQATPKDPAVVVITGASSGIGEATAEAFARDGADVVLAARDLDALEAVARRCRDLGARALAVATDVVDAGHRTGYPSRLRRGGGMGGWQAQAAGSCRHAARSGRPTSKRALHENSYRKSF
jgi:NAD(P)-dependent dehydrogenase (short-subunit alcohol dehydrogenase family)